MRRYTSVARALHWAIAALVLANIATGIAHGYVNHDWPVIPLHKSIGMSVLALTLVRIGWRMGHRPPPLPAMPAWEKGAAHGLHALFYALMLALPLTGWVIASGGDKPLRWFGVFALPKLAVGKGDALFGLAHGSHGVLGLVFGTLVAVHVGAALRHHFVLRDEVLRRMLG